MEKILTKEQLKKFMEERPMVSPAGLSKEAGLAECTVRFLFTQNRNITKRISDKLIPVMQKYGCKSVL